MNSNIYVHPTVVFNAEAQLKLESDTGLIIGLQGARMVLCERPLPIADLTQEEIDRTADRILLHDFYTDLLDGVVSSEYAPNGQFDIVYVAD
jgi:hypothetical protein